MSTKNNPVGAGKVAAATKTASNASQAELSVRAKTVAAKPTKVPVDVPTEAQAKAKIADKELRKKRLGEGDAEGNDGDVVVSDSGVEASSDVVVAQLGTPAGASVAASDAGAAGAASAGAGSAGAFAGLTTAQILGLSLGGLAFVGAAASSGSSSNSSPSGATSGTDTGGGTDTGSGTGTTPVDLSTLTPAQITALPVATVAGWTTEQVASLSPTQVAALTPTQLQALSTAQVAAITAEQAAALSVDQFLSLTPAQIAALAPAVVAAVPASTFAQLSTEQLAAVTATQAPSLPVEQLVALTPAKLGALQPATLANTDADVISALSNDQLAGLTLDQLGALTDAQGAALSAGQFASLSDAAVAALSAPAISGLSPTIIGELSADEFGLFTSVQLAALTAAQGAAMTADQVASLDGTEFAALSASAVSGLSSEIIALLVPAQLAAFTATQVAALTIEQIDALTEAQIPLLSGSALAGLSAVQLASMTVAQLEEMTIIQVQSITPEALVNLSNEQLVALDHNNLAPTFASDTASATAMENLATSSVVYTARATDSNIAAPNNTVVYSLTGADASNFTVDSATGEVQFVSSPDYEAQTSYTFNVVATDGGGLNTVQAVTVSVSDVNEAPTVTVALADTSANTESAFSYVVPAGTFADPDTAGSGNATLTYSATLANGSALPSWLSFDAATHTFSGTPPSTESGAFFVRVTATDGGGLSAHDDFTLTITSAPTITSALADGAAVTNLDVGSNIVLKVSEDVTAVAGKFIRIVNDGGTGFHGEATDHTLLIDVTDASQVTIVNGVITINPSLNLDLSNSYHIEIDEGAFVGVTSGQASGGVIGMDFETVAPGTSSIANAVQSVYMDALGDLVNGTKWLDLENIGSPSASNPTSIDAGGDAYTFVFKDSSAAQSDPSAGFDGVGANGDGFFVRLNNFGTNDLVYIDDQSNGLDPANDLASSILAPSKDDIPADAGVTVLQINPNNNLGGQIYMDVEGATTYYETLVDLSAFMGVTPIVSA